MTFARRLHLSMPDSKPIRVSVVYALPDRVLQKELSLASGSTVADAIAESGLAQAIPQAESGLKFGIFSQATAAHTLLRDGDRVEVYRPLQIDPKQARRKRALRT